MPVSIFVGSVVAFAVGVGWRTVFTVPLAMTLWLLVISFGLAMVWRKRSFTSFAPHVLLASICLSFCAVGILRTEVATWQFAESSLSGQLGQVVELRGVVDREPDYSEKTVRLYVKTDTDTVLVSADRLLKVHYGDEVNVKGKLRKPESFTTDLGRTFNYPGYLLARGVEYEISFAEVEATGVNEGNQVVTTLLRAKAAFIKSLEQIIPEPQVGLGEGLLLGVKSALGADIEDNFRRTGIIHIVVLSGYNVMLVVAFFMFLFSFFLPLRVRMAFGIVSIIAFALIVGLSATVVRASIMAALLLVAQASGRRYDVLRALLLAGTVMIVINPYLLLYDIGFQLSFMATLGLLLFTPQFETSIIKKTSHFGAKDFFLATVATQVAVLPLLIYHIGQVSLISVVVNVLVLPMVAPAMLLTFLAGLAGFFSSVVASAFGWLASLALTYILVIADWFAVLPFAAAMVPQFGALGVLVMYILIGVGLIAWQKRQATENVLKDWTIELEAEKVGRDQRSRPADQKDTPVFFR